MDQTTDIHDYVWANLRPLVVEVAEAVREQDPNVLVSINDKKTRHRTFVAYAEFWKFGLSGIFDTSSTTILYMSCARSLLAPSDAGELECQSRISRANGRGFIVVGPRSFIEIDKGEGEMRAQMDLWIRATEVFVRANISAIVRQVHWETPGLR
jgi:hypothetical protein